MQHYTVSKDGRRMVFVTASDAERAGVWIATLDGRSPPRQLAPRGSQAFFGAGDEVLFGSWEGDDVFVYRVRPDGSG
jgi:Tol biopolymer transport system component